MSSLNSSAKIKNPVFILFEKNRKITGEEGQKVHTFLNVLKRLLCLTHTYILKYAKKGKLQ